jgi:hypothetical protein
MEITRNDGTKSSFCHDTPIWFVEVQRGMQGEDEKCRRSLWEPRVNKRPCECEQNWVKLMGIDCDEGGVIDPCVPASHVAREHPPIKH